jgi:hypothetical protein
MREGRKEGRMGKLLLLLLRWKTVVDHHCSFCFHFSTGEEEEEEEEEEEQEEEEEERQNGKTVEGMGITSVGAHSGSFQIRVCFRFMEIPSLLNGFFFNKIIINFFDSMLIFVITPGKHSSMSVFCLVVVPMSINLTPSLLIMSMAH